LNVLFTNLILITWDSSIQYQPTIMVIQHNFGRQNSVRSDAHFEVKIF